MPQTEKNVLVVGGGYQYYQPFRKFGKYTQDQSLFNKPENVSLVLFTGGADISPSLYGHKPSAMTWCTPRRDVYELLAYRRARKHNLPIAGICRGAQFLCAMAGGTLFQHVESHALHGTHSMETWDGRTFYVTSTHHQMQNPPKDAKVLGWSEKRRSGVYIGEDDTESEPPECEYECVHYPNINAVGMQYHPEIMSEHSPGFRFPEELVKTFLKVQI
jgi:gamma-glutamyl-gamma-aminobutyrate hydrolase PuuD